MKRLGLALACCWLVGFAATAEAAPYLGAGEACRVAGRIIYQEFSNIEKGSGPCYTQAHPTRRNVRLVDKYYRDKSGQCWVTTLNIRETWRGYRYRILNDSRVRSSFCY